MANPHVPILVKLNNDTSNSNSNSNSNSASISSEKLNELARAGGALAISISSSSSSSSSSSLPSSLPSTLPTFIHDDPSSSLDPESILKSLDSGSEAVITARPQALIQSGIPIERIILHSNSTSNSGSSSSTNSLDASHGESLKSYAGISMEFPSESQIDFQEIEKRAGSIDCKSNGKPIYVSISDPSGSISNQTAIKLAKLNASPLISQSNYLTDFDLSGLILSSLTSDRPDGLYPTVVTNSSGVSLGLVYSSSESLRESIKTGLGVYQSRSRGLWRKGSTSGATQELIKVRLDCDSDALEFKVRQRKGTGFCHLPEPVRGNSCFGPIGGLASLENTLLQRLVNAPKESYTARIFKDKDLLASKIKEEADELISASDEDPNHVAFEAADLLYFALARCVRAGVGIEEIEKSLEIKAKKVSRRKGDAKPQYVNGSASKEEKASSSSSNPNPTPVVQEKDSPIQMKSYFIENLSQEEKVSLLQRPSIKSEAIQDLVRPIIAQVKSRGDDALLELTSKFDGVKLDSCMKSPPFINEEILKTIKPEVKSAIDVAYSNIRKFHLAQKKVGGNVQSNGEGVTEDVDDSILQVETMPGIVCKRFSRPIQRVGLYVPGGSAILPSTALMLGIPAQVAKCSTIVLATPPRKDGSIAPEVLYVASLVGATNILCAGGAQAVAAMAYGTESCPKVDKIVGPGNQFVTAAKMLVQNDTNALVSIDMPAGPSEVLVIADKTSNPHFVASDLLSQAEHGPDSQVILVAIDLNKEQLSEIEKALDSQARVLPRANVVRKAIEKSLTIVVRNRQEALDWSNDYAPEHLIIQTDQPEELAKGVINAGSIFVGQWSPESCGDYASGTNHTLPTYGFARQYSGVSTSTFEKHITSQNLTREGLLNLGPHVVQLAECEGLEAHANAVRLRLNSMK